VLAGSYRQRPSSDFVYPKGSLVDGQRAEQQADEEQRDKPKISYAVRVGLRCSRAINEAFQWLRLHEVPLLSVQAGRVS